MNKDSFVADKVEQFAGRFPKQPFLPDMKAFVGSSLSSAIEHGAKMERERIETLAEESIEYPNGTADGAWVYLGRLKQIINTPNT